MTMTDVVAPARAKAPGPRLAGIDIARALALLGMFVVHLDLAGQGVATEGGPPPQSGLTVATFFSGRAMPLFVLLSGIGLTLLLRSRDGRPAAVLGRAAVLLLLGAVMSGSGGIAVILHFYALYLLVGLLAHRLGDRALLALTVGVAAVGVAVQVWAALHGWSGSDRQPSFLGGFKDLTDPAQYVQDLLVTGAYPLFPDGAFFLAGMWVGRLRLGRVRTATGVAVAGAALLAAGLAVPAVAAPFADRVEVVTLAHQFAQETGDLTPAGLSAYAEQQGTSAAELTTLLREQWDVDLAQLAAAAKQPLPSPAETKLAELVTYAPHDHMPPWLLQATGGGLLALGLCLLLAARLPAAGALLVVGRYALSAYVAHWVFLVLVESRWTERHGLATAVLLWLGAVVLAYGWSRWRTTGPVEALLRTGGRLAAQAVDRVRSRRERRLGV